MLFRSLRIVWTSRACMQKGSSVAWVELILRVRVGFATRTETIPLNMAWGLAGTAQSDCS